MNFQKIANTVARKCGYGRATEIVFEDVPSPYVKGHTSYGWRKYTTGEYVPMAYLINFGWKNTYYQHAETVVVLPTSLNTI